MPRPQHLPLIFKSVTFMFTEDNFSVNIRTFAIMKNRLTYCLLTAVAFLCCGGLRAQETKDLSILEGLSQYDVTDIVQDRYGYLWISTYDDLNRYDGSTVRQYRHDSSLPGSLSLNRVKALNYDSARGELWIGTDGGGINVFDYGRDSFRHYWYTKDHGPSNPSNDIVDITPENDGRVWVATRKNAYLTTLTDSLLIVQNIPYGNGPFIRQVIQHGDCMITVMNSELRRYIKEGGKYRPDMVISIPDDARTRHAAISSQGELFVATNDGLCFAPDARGSGSLERISFSLGQGLDDSDDIQSISFYGDFMIIAVAGKGLFRIRDFDGSPCVCERIPTTSPSFWEQNDIRTMYADGDGMLWISSSRQGVGVVDLSRRIFSHMEPVHDSRSSNLFSRLSFGPDGDLWIGSNYGDLFRMRPDGMVIKYDMPPGPVTDIFFDGGKVWVSALGNILLSEDPSRHDSFAKYYSNSNPQPKGLPNLGHAYAFVTDKFGTQWIGCRLGIIRISNGKVSTIPFEHQGTIRLVADDIAGRIWACSSRAGIMQIDLDDDGEITDKRIYSSTEDSLYTLGSDIIWALTVTRSSDVYVGTDEGMGTIDPDSHLTGKMPRNSLLCNCKVSAITEDSSGILWINTSKGIVRRDPSDSSERLFDTSDGMSGNSMTEAAAISPHGTVFVGSNEGIDFFNPDDISTIRQASPLLVSELRVNSLTVHEGDKTGILKESIFETPSIRLRHDQNNVAFEISILSFKHTRREGFWYRLEAYDSKWSVSEPGQRTVSYSKLPPGKYRFQIAPYMSFTDPPEVVRSIDIRVLPAPFASPMAIILYVLLFSAGVALVIIRSRRDAERKKADMIEKIRQQTEKEANEKRVKYYANITHELRVPLTLVTAPLEDIAARKDLPEDVNYQIQIMKRNGDRLRELINQFLELMKIDREDVEIKLVDADLVAEIKDIASRFSYIASQKNIRFNVLSSVDSLAGRTDRDKLSKIIANLLSNAFKFTDKGGVITLGINREGEMICIEVSDTGCGIPEDELRHIFERFYQSGDKPVSGTGIGLELVSNLVTMLGGTISVSSECGKGSVFTVRLPIYIQDGLQETTRAGDDLGEILDEDSDAERNATVLIVEDDHDMRDYIRSALKDRYKVLEAADGLEGYEMAGRYIPDLIISDVMMPKMDGIELCEKLSGDFKTSHIPIIILSAKDDVTKGLESGAIDYILKPFSTRNLVLKINNLLKTRDERQLSNLGEGSIREKIEHFDEEKEKKFLQRAFVIVEERMASADFSVEDLFRELGVSRTQLHNKITALTGESASAFIRNIRLDKAAELLGTGKYTVSEALYSVGFNNPSYFAKTFRARFGKSPSDLLAK